MATKSNLVIKDFIGSSYQLRSKKEWRNLWILEAFSYRPSGPYAIIHKDGKSKQISFKYDDVVEIGELLKARLISEYDTGKHFDLYDENGEIQN